MTTGHFRLHFMSLSQALLTLGFLLLNKVSHPYYSTYSPVSQCFNSSGVLRQYSFLRMTDDAPESQFREGRKQELKQYVGYYIHTSSGVYLFYCIYTCQSPLYMKLLRAIPRCVLLLICLAYSNDSGPQNCVSIW